MKDDQQFIDELYSGLRALAETSFPRKCPNCGRLFETAEQFISETQDIRTSDSGLKESAEEDGSTIIELFRNCPCGSTLMDLFGDRRDFAEAGTKIRHQFSELLDSLVANGLEYNVARTELIKVMRGSKSEVLAKIRTPD